MTRRPVATPVAQSAPHSGEGPHVPIESPAAAYLRHRDRVFTVIYRLVGDPSDAADLTHDAFVRAFEHAASFRGGESAVGTWLLRIAINVALAHRRRVRWFARFTHQPPSLPTSAPTVVGPVSSEALDLDRAIRGLPSALRTAFVLHTVEGYPYAEIASVLGTSEAPCRQRIHRARTQLAAALREYREARAGAEDHRTPRAAPTAQRHGTWVGPTGDERHAR